VHTPIHVSCAINIAIILSVYTTIESSTSIPISQRRKHINLISLTASEIATYSASLLDKDTPLYAFDLQQTGAFIR
jgi:hypothetical protein